LPQSAVTDAVADMRTLQASVQSRQQALTEALDRGDASQGADVSDTATSQQVRRGNEGPLPALLEWQAGIENRLERQESSTTAKLQELEKLVHELGQEVIDLGSVQMQLAESMVAVETKNVSPWGRDAKDAGAEELWMKSFVDDKVQNVHGRMSKMETALEQLASEVRVLDGIAGAIESVKEQAKMVADSGASGWEERVGALEGTVLEVKSVVKTMDGVMRGRVEELEAQFMTHLEGQVTLLRDVERARLAQQLAAVEASLEARLVAVEAVARDARAYEEQQQLGVRSVPTHPTLQTDMGMEINSQAPPDKWASHDHDQSIVERAEHTVATAQLNLELAYLGKCQMELEARLVMLEGLEGRVGILEQVVNECEAETSTARERPHDSNPM